MGEISILRADFYSDGTIVPILVSYEDGRSEFISSVRSVEKNRTGRGCIIHCSTLTKNLTLIFSDSKWKITYIDA